MMNQPSEDFCFFSTFRWNLGSITNLWMGVLSMISGVRTTFLLLTFTTRFLGMCFKILNLRWGTKKTMK